MATSIRSGSAMSLREQLDALVGQTVRLRVQPNSWCTVRGELRDESDFADYEMHVIGDDFEAEATHVYIKIENVVTVEYASTIPAIIYQPPE